MAWTQSPPPAPPGLQEEAQILQQWASEKQSARIVGLLTTAWMCELALPPRTRRLAGVSEAHWLRILFCRHFQQILGWKERLSEGNPAGFSDKVNWLIRHNFFPEQVGGCQDSEVARAGEGSGADASRVISIKHTTTSEAAIECTRRAHEAKQF